MADLNDITASGDASGTEGNATASATAPVQTPDELAQLKSRNSGLNAKVGELQKQLEDERKARTTAEAAVGSNEKADESLRKQLADALKQLEDGKVEVALATAGAKYPEAYALLGKGIAGLPSEDLAALEARLKAAKDDGGEAQGGTPTPLANNQQRAVGGSKSIEDMTAAEVKAYMARLDPSVMGLPSKAS